MHRREFIAGTAMVLMLPHAARGQQADRVFRIGVLETVPPTQNAANFEAFRGGLRALGYVEGQNLTIDYRSADGHNDFFPRLADELLAAKVELIVTRGTPAVLAAKSKTTKIPIVMAAIGEPLMAVSQIAHPGGNVTGLSAFVTDLQAKRVELLRDAVPRLSSIGALMNMGNPIFTAQWAEISNAARALGLRSRLLDVRKREALSAAVRDAAADGVDGLIVAIDSLTQANRREIGELAIAHRLPAVFASREFVDAGGLMAYGPSYPDLYRRAASYVHKIFKGAAPGDLPVEQPTIFELLINAKTAAAIGLTMPPTLLARANEVIE